MVAVAVVFPYVSANLAQNRGDPEHCGTGNHELRQVQYRRLDDTTLDVFEPQLYRAIRAEAHNPSTVPPGEYRRVVKQDSNGMKMVEWIGQVSFIKDFTRPGRRVTSFRTDQGFVDASGRPLR